MHTYIHIYIYLTKKYKTYTLKQQKLLKERQPKQIERKGMDGRLNMVRIASQIDLHIQGNTCQNPSDLS